MMRIHAPGYAKWSKWMHSWLCDCGTRLPAPLSKGRLVVSCRSCGALWQYGRWPLFRWAGDKVRTRLQPRRVTGKGQGELHETRTVPPANSTAREAVSGTSEAGRVSGTAEREGEAPQEVKGGRALSDE